MTQSEGPIRRNFSNDQRSTAVAPPMLRRAAREHRRWIGDVSLNHRRCYHIDYSSPMFTRASPMCCRCIADVSGTFLALVYIAESSPTARRCSVKSPMVFGSKHREKISMHALKFLSMSRCLGEADGENSRTSPIIRRTTGAWWRCPGDAQMCASREHREA